MSPSRWYGRLGLAAALAVAPAVQAQQITPHIGYVYPAGGRQGASFEVTVGGQFLDGVKQAYVSGAGVEVSVVKHVKLLTQGQFNKLREQLMELTAKKEPT
ncbi:MAG: hypothetical protein NT090_21530, partial [Acidobacteria bacterium]|nr:hypothetical protein [Acidobacteriota bacterium]